MRSKASDRDYRQAAAYRQIAAFIGMEGAEPGAVVELVKAMDKLGNHAMHRDGCNGDVLGKSCNCGLEAVVQAAKENNDGR